jgi:hypothetical protein
LKNTLQLITYDLFDISSRLKEIDDDYIIYFNYADGGFEVHNKRQRGNTLCLKLPYPELDGRTIELVRKTRVENAAALLADIERDNALLERRSTQEKLEEYNESFRHY